MGGEEHYDMYYFFSLKQNVKDILINGHRRKEQQKESDISKSIEKVKPSIKPLRDIIETELDFHGYGTAKIESQLQLGDINPFMCELHQNLFDILDFNPAVKLINITLPYENDENDIDFGVVEQKNGLKL